MVHQDAENTQKTFCHSKCPGIDPSQNSPDGEESDTTCQPQGLFWRGEIMVVGHGCLRARGERHEDHEQGAVPGVEGKDPTVLKASPTWGTKLTLTLV